MQVLTIEIYVMERWFLGIERMLFLNYVLGKYNYKAVLIFGVLNSIVV
jgi:hypothetical protein